jgi:uncharacterized protein (TIGR02246 family)
MAHLPARLRDRDYEKAALRADGLAPRRSLRSGGVACIAGVALALSAGGCRGAAGGGAPAETARTEIRALLDRQSRAWNAGDLAGYMDAYTRSDQLRFHSGGDVTLGWQTVFDRYRARYQDRAAMGQLAFTDLAIELHGPDTALVHGRWRLQRAQDQPSGLFTLLLRRERAGWRIHYDHTSAK